MPKIYSPFGQIVRGHFDRNPVAGQDPDAVFLHPAGRIGKGLVPIVEPDSKTRIGQQFEHRTLKFDQIFFGQSVLLNSDGGTEVPPFNRLSLNRAKIDGRHPTALTLLKLVAEPLSFPQIIHSGALDGRDVDEDVSTAALGLDKSIALLRIEPFDRTGRHQQ